MHSKTTRYRTHAPVTNILQRDHITDTARGGVRKLFVLGDHRGDRYFVPALFGSDELQKVASFAYILAHHAVFLP